MPLYARKRDSNERKIIDALIQSGCYVIQENNIDLYVITPNGKVLLMEVKTKNGKLTPYQVKLHGQIKAHGAIEVHIIRTVDEALSLIEES